ncbi:MAG: acetyltransferase [Desulfovibrionales bacterium]|nr:acetyltransferase [Desulfovibrionales bacterium]
MTDVYIIGASGHGKVVQAALRTMGMPVGGFFDDDPGLLGGSVCGIPVLGPVRDFGLLERPRGVIAIGKATIRQRTAQSFPQAEWLRVVHASSWVDISVDVGDGSIVCAGGVVQPDSVLGRHCIINTGATIDHDCRVGDYAHVCPGAHLGGNVHVGTGSWIGIGSQVIQGVAIGANVTVGAGSTVLRDVPDNAVVVGSPARIVRYDRC